MKIPATPVCLRLLTVILVAVWSCSLAQPAEATVHVVARSETLRSVAHKYSVTVADLARQNGLTASARLRVGQRLVIPAKVTAPRNTGLAPPVTRAINSAGVKPGRWRYIVIHHSGTDFGTVKGMDRYHREERHMENGLAYHFVIGNGRGMGNGEVAVGGRWTRQLDGGHLASEDLNRVSLGICLIGNFEKDRPTPQQLASLKALAIALLDRCALKTKAVTTHQQIHPRHTQCPGRKFPAKQFMTDLPRR